MNRKSKKNTFELETIPVAIGGKKLELLSVKRWDAIENNPFSTDEEYIKNFPLWIKVWEASIVLSEHLATINIKPNTDILELGAGMGLTGLIFGAMGHNVTITDYNDDALEMLQKNADHNKITNIRVKKLDWFQPELEGMFDIICGSELIYKEDAIDPVINILKRYLKPEGSAYIAHDLKRLSMKMFVQKAREFFQIESRWRSLDGKEQACTTGVVALGHRPGIGAVG